LSQVNPYLESVQQRQGLYAFKVVMDETNNTADVVDRNELVGQIFLQPTRTAEFIVLDFNVLPTGAVFPA
jgi:phage tail sheath protein FI